MNRRGHYQEAEKFLKLAVKGSANLEGQLFAPAEAQMLQSAIGQQIAIAQVHATLATVPARWIAGESYDDQHAAIAAADEGNPTDG